MEETNFTNPVPTSSSTSNVDIRALNEKIQKESYRQVLRIMADDLDNWVSRDKIKSQFKGADSILNNAIKALRDRHIILSKEGERGMYRLQHKGFALWIKLHMQDYQNE